MKLTPSALPFIQKIAAHSIQSHRPKVLPSSNAPQRCSGLRFKVTSIVAGSFTILFLAQFAIVRTILLRNFEQLEENLALINAERLQNAITEKTKQLEVPVTDYAVWDETYRFIEGRRPGYIQSQLDGVLFTAQVNAIAITNRTGNILVQKGSDFNTFDEGFSQPEFSKYTLLSAKALDNASHGKIKGILETSQGSMLVASQPVLKGTGGKIRNGVLSMGRFINSQMLKELSATLQLTVKLHRFRDSTIPKDVRSAIGSKLQNTKIATQTLDKNTIASYVQVNDVFEKPAFIMTFKNDRKIYAKGVESLSYYFWSTLLIGVAFCVLVLKLLDSFVLSRLSHLSQGVKDIGYQGTLSARVLLQGQDELTQLAKTINYTLDQLQEVQQALQSSEERYALAVVGANDGIWDWDLLKGDVYFSPRWKKILGFADKDFEQTLDTWFGHLHPQDLFDFKAAIEAHLDGSSPYLEHEHRMIRKDGSSCWVICRGSAVRDSKGTPYRMAGSLTDISDRKAAAQMLARQTEELARSNQELEQFAYIASHDLQEPLRKIEAFGDRLKRKYDTILDDQGHDYLARMQTAAGRMRILIQDLLAFSRVTTQTRGFTSLSLSTLLQEVLSDLEVRAQETQAQVTIGPMPTLEADALQMRQLFQNLIGNALKFQQPGVPPVISIQCCKEDRVESDPSQPFCRITVSDNGIGFDEKYLDRIFKVFQRLHGRTEYEGTGIGLAVCAKIVERHGGQLTAQSTPGEGATFIVSLPLRQPKIEGDNTP